MYFSHGNPVKAPDYVNYLLLRQLPALRVTLRLVIGTEPAVIDTYVRGLNVKITVKVNGITAVRFLASVDNTASRDRFRLTVECQGLVGCYSFSVEYCFCNLFEPVVVCLRIISFIYRDIGKFTFAVRQ